MAGFDSFLGLKQEARTFSMAPIVAVSILAPALVLACRPAEALHLPGLTEALEGPWPWSCTKHRELNFYLSKLVWNF